MLFMFFVGCVTVSDVMGGDGAARWNTPATVPVPPAAFGPAAPLSGPEMQRLMMAQQQMMAPQQQAAQLALLAIPKAGPAAQPGSNEPGTGEGHQDGSSSQTSGDERFTWRGKGENTELLFDGVRLPQYISDRLSRYRFSKLLNDINSGNKVALEILHDIAPQLFEEAQDSSDPNGPPASNRQDQTPPQSPPLVLKKPGEPLGNWGKAARWGTGLVHAGILANLIAELAGDRNALLDLLNLNKKLRNNEKFKRFLGKQDKSIKKSKSARAARIMISIAQAIALDAGTNWLHKKLIAPAAMRRDIRPVKLPTGYAEPIFGDGQ
jgi:hypothetical protein